MDLCELWRDLRANDDEAGREAIRKQPDDDTRWTTRICVGPRIAELSMISFPL
jgi:hypothetical protein